MSELSSDSTIENRLVEEPFVFDFFQAVRLLRHLANDLMGPIPARETVRFAPLLSLAFPASAIHDFQRGKDNGETPKMSVTFFGLTGPSGILPRHYTEMLLRVERELKGPQKRALQEWLDIFNHRLISLFYASWEKYRFVLPFERGEADRKEPEEPDGFTKVLLASIGLGTRGLRDRIRVDVPGEDGSVRQLAHVDDLGLFRFAGLLAQQHRSAWCLGVLLGGYFRVPVAVEQFQGQWLILDPPSQSRLGTIDGNCDLGLNVVVGDRVWDIQGKFRTRIGPLTFSRFMEFIPDPDPAVDRKAFFLLARLIRLYVGPEFDFDVQLVLEGDHVPPCTLDDHDAGPRLGWNCWLLSEPLLTPADDAIFDGELAATLGSSL